MARRTSPKPLVPEPASGASSKGAPAGAAPAATDASSPATGGSGGPTGAPMDIAQVIRDLPEDKQNRILSRIVKRDRKGRPYGTPRNPDLPSVEVFNPQVVEVRAADLEAMIKDTKHGQDPDQVARVQALSNEELVKFDMEVSEYGPDPIGGARAEDGGLALLTGGHHRTAEIARRVAAGELPADTVVRILVHD